MSIPNVLRRVRRALGHPVVGAFVPMVWAIGSVFHYSRGSFVAALLCLGFGLMYAICAVAHAVTQSARARGIVVVQLDGPAAPRTEATHAD